jgi:hypothetical protein
MFNDSDDKWSYLSSQFAGIYGMVPNGISTKGYYQKG